MLVRLAALAALILVGGCASATSEAPSAGGVDLASGEALYQATCAECHGADLRGTDRGPSHLSIVYEPSHHSDAAFLLAVRNGVRAHHFDYGDMPAIPGLSDEEVADITAYIRSVQEREGFEPYP
jgi:mono/diheme cytochrome c family protein